ncbi:phage replication protein [Candidatus Termititenax persephonae]|uniref:Phage replication protein n=1 Tax=Candidatus Termititenax persephonae TaxID=2218525 RepID=A0A388TJD0_9BACT|nr:phage replication protein [Candidatus Termititenax persephonae]
MLESLTHSDITFLTLTYDDEHLPDDCSVSRRPLQLFIKSLREAVSPVKIRFYGVGEYGEQSQRPHYHAIIYGLPPEYDFQRHWRHGFVMAGTFSRESAQYVAGYVVKKFVKKGDLRRREFSTMSLKPALGLEAVRQMEKYKNHPIFKRALKDTNDVPGGLRHGSHWLPFGRYLTDKLREIFNVTGDLDPYIRSLSLKYLKNKDNYLQSLLDEDAQRVKQIENRFKIFSNSTL